MEADEKYIESMRLSMDQMQLNQEIDEDGFSEKLLERQFRINKKRSDCDIVDRDEVIYKDDDGREFVQ